jgi:hypothetical protein
MDVGFSMAVKQCLNIAGSPIQQRRKAGILAHEFLGLPHYIEGHCSGAPAAIQSMI